MRRTPRLIFAGIAGFTAFATLSCSELPIGPGDGGGDFTVSVQVSEKPRYSWSAGAALNVQVARASDLSTYSWWISDPNNRNISSPVTHGTAPQNALVLEDEETTLTPGILYRVTVTLADGTTKGYREFRP